MGIPQSGWLINAEYIDHELQDFRPGAVPGQCLTLHRASNPNGAGIQTFDMVTDGAGGAIVVSAPLDPSTYVIPIVGQRMSSSGQASWASSGEERGKHLFRLACKRELEGIVAKRKFDPYLLDNAKCYKIRNRNYSQRVGRETLFERERSTDPNGHYWNVRASARDQLVEA